MLFFFQSQCQLILVCQDHIKVSDSSWEVVLVEPSAADTDWSVYLYLIPDDWIGQLLGLGLDTKTTWLVLGKEDQFFSNITVTLPSSCLLSTLRELYITHHWLLVSHGTQTLVSWVKVLFLFDPSIPLWTLWLFPTSPDYSFARIVINTASRGCCLTINVNVVRIWWRTYCKWLFFWWERATHHQIYLYINRPNAPSTHWLSATAAGPRSGPTYPCVKNKHSPLIHFCFPVNTLCSDPTIMWSPVCSKLWTAKWSC